MVVSRSIIFFGDASLDTAAALKRFLLSIDEGSLHAKFAQAVHKTLQDECLKLSVLERSETTSLEDIHSLFRRSGDDNSIHPALQAAEIVFLQLGSFIAWVQLNKAEHPLFTLSNSFCRAYEQNHFEQYPTTSNSLIVGVCLGELSATAVTLASSLIQLLPLAIEAVRVAFRAGLAADRVARELEQVTSPRQSWSVAISRDNVVIDQNVLCDVHTKIVSHSSFHSMI